MALDILILAYLDRARGMGVSLVSGDTTLLMGWMVAHMLGHTYDLLALGIAILFARGEGFGWGRQMERAAKGNWWPLVGRGAVWGACPALLGFFDWHIYLLLPIMMIAMPGSYWLARLSAPIQFKFKDFEILPETWGRMEFFRGGLVGIMIVLTRGHCYVWT